MAVREPVSISTRRLSSGRPGLICRVGVLALRPQTLQGAMVGEYTHPTFKLWPPSRVGQGSVGYR